MKPKTLKKLIHMACDFLPVVNRHKPDAECIALEKRRLENDLRSRGMSHKEAKTEVSQRFKA